MSALTPVFVVLSVTTLTFFGVCLFLAKLSIFLLYLRFFEVSRITRRLIQAGIISSFAALIGTSAAFGALCYPISAQSKTGPEALGLCFEKALPTFWAQGISTVLIDMHILVLPLVIVYRLQMPVRKRLQAMTIFATAIMWVPFPLNSRES